MRDLKPMLAEIFKDISTEPMVFSDSITRNRLSKELIIISFMQLVIINMLNLKLLLYFPFFLLSYFLFLLPGTAKPEVIFPTCPYS